MKKVISLFPCIFVCMSLYTQAQSVVINAGSSIAINSPERFYHLKNEGRLAIINTTLHLDGVITGAGVIDGSSTSSLVADSGANGTVYFNADSARCILKDLIVFGNLSIGSRLYIAGEQLGTITSSGNLNTNGFVTLRSNVIGTARIGTSSGSIVGSLTIERFIPARRAWRFLSIPLKLSLQSINAAWQGGFTNTTLVCPLQYPGTQGYDMHVTNKGINGYDKNITQNPSLMFFQNNAWVAPLSTLATHITDYEAYCAFVRGDRSICLTQGVNAIPNTTVLRTFGTVNVGSVIRTTSYVQDEYMFNGNPYASSINILDVLNRSVGIVPNTFWVWDPTYGTVGGYITYSDGVSTPVTPTYPTPESVCVVQSGQAFMTQAADISQTIRYEENDKTVLQSVKAFGRPTTHSVLQIRLNAGTNGFRDGIAAEFFEHTMQSPSVSKIPNLVGEGILFEGKSARYSIERRVHSMPDTLAIGFLSLKQVTYTLELLPTNDLKQLKFVDRLLHRQIEIVDTLRYQFVVSDTNSWKNRFFVVYSKDSVAQLLTAMSVVPTLVTNTVTVKGIDPATQVRITDVLGRTYISTKKHTIDCARLKAGVYFLTADKESVQFIKQ